MNWVTLTGQLFIPYITPSLSPCWSVWLKGQEVSFPCSYRCICYSQITTILWQVLEKWNCTACKETSHSRQSCTPRMRRTRWSTCWTNQAWQRSLWAVLQFRHELYEHYFRQDHFFSDAHKKEILKSSLTFFHVFFLKRFFVWPTSFANNFMTGPIIAKLWKRVDDDRTSSSLIA